MSLVTTAYTTTAQSLGRPVEQDTWAVGVATRAVKSLGGWQRMGEGGGGAAGVSIITTGGECRAGDLGVGF